LPAGPVAPAGPASPCGPVRPVAPAGPACPAGPVAPAAPAGPWAPVWFQEIAVVPFGQVVPEFWSTNTCEPLSSAFVQQPWITPELSTGPGLDFTAAAAMSAPAARTSAVAPIR